MEFMKLSIKELISALNYRFYKCEWVFLITTGAFGLIFMYVIHIYPKLSYLSGNWLIEAIVVILSSIGVGILTADLYKFCFKHGSIYFNQRSKNKAAVKMFQFQLRHFDQREIYILERILKNNNELLMNGSNEIEPFIAIGIVDEVEVIKNKMVYRINDIYLKTLRKYLSELNNKK